MIISTNLIIFGGIGDLTFRKLLPAPYTMDITGKLPQDSCITTIGRRDYDSSHYCQISRDWAEKFTRFSFEEKAFDRFLKKIDYYRMGFSRLEAYHGLNHYYRENDISSYIFYFAVAPCFFSVITEGLKLVYGSSSGKVVLEKPFGENLAAAAVLNIELEAFSGPEHIYRIDHYLGKEMVRDIQAIRSSNPIFADAWNSYYIESMQISALGDMGVETRGSYCDASGTLKDMVQNHLFRILSIMAMERLEEFNPRGLYDAQPDAFRCLRPADEMSIESTLVLGQYEGYHGEPLVKPDSQTETHGAPHPFIDSECWKGTPFYIRTGKKIGKRETELAVTFHRPYPVVEPSVLIIKIQPMEGVYLQFNIKRPGDSEDTIPAKVDFCQNCSLIHQPSTPEAYECFITACMAGERSWLSQWDQIELGWSYISHLKKLHARKQLLVYPYKPGAHGPAGVDRMLEQYEHSWLQTAVMAAGQPQGGLHVYAPAASRT